MASFSDYAKLVLAGGLPAVLDNNAAPRTQQGDSRPEQTAPTASVKDMEAWQIGGMNISPGLVIGGLAGLALLAIVVAAVRR